MIKSEQEWAKKKEEIRKKNFPHKIRQRLSAWVDKKEMLLDKLGELKGADRNDVYNEENSTAIYQEKLLITTEIEELEQVNITLYERLQMLRSEASNNRQYENLGQEQEKRIKDQYLNCLAEKNDLNTEISFMHDELQDIDSQLKVSESSYNDNMKELSLLIEQIRFASGEVEVWADKMNSLEERVPEQYRELTYINDQIETANQALYSLGERLRTIEYNVKTAYYKGKGKI